MAYVRKIKTGMWTVAIRKLNQKPLWAFDNLSKKKTTNIKQAEKKIAEIKKLINT